MDNKAVKCTLELVKLMSTICHKPICVYECVCPINSIVDVMCFTIEGLDQVLILT